MTPIERLRMLARSASAVRERASALGDEVAGLSVELRALTTGTRHHERLSEGHPKVMELKERLDALTLDRDEMTAQFQSEGRLVEACREVLKKSGVHIGNVVL